MLDVHFARCRCFEPRANRQVCYLTECSIIIKTNEKCHNVDRESRELGANTRGWDEWVRLMRDETTIAMTRAPRHISLYALRYIGFKHQLIGATLYLIPRYRTRVIKRVEKGLLIFEPEIKSAVPIALARRLVCLVGKLLLLSQLTPCSLFGGIQPTQPPPKPKITRLAPWRE